MGNCVFRGFATVDQVIKVITSNGGVMELYPPITAECITNEFPGHGIFRAHDLFSQPLLHNEELLTGELYYLLPLKCHRSPLPPEATVQTNPIPSSVAAAPYRMSFDTHGLWRRPDTEWVNNGGVWKVKLVISPEQLSEILSQEAQTEALIESVRTVAKCSSGVTSTASSDQWSLSSSRKGSLERMI